MRQFLFVFTLKPVLCFLPGLYVVFIVWIYFKIVSIFLKIKYYCLFFYTFCLCRNAQYMLKFRFLLYKCKKWKYFSLWERFSEKKFTKIFRKRKKKFEKKGFCSPERVAQSRMIRPSRSLQRWVVWSYVTPKQHRWLLSRSINFPPQHSVFYGFFFRWTWPRLIILPFWKFYNFESI